MPRPLRIEYPGALWHLTNRGVERRDIVTDDQDRHTFVDLMAGVVTRFRWRLHSWVLMTNHFHLVVETPETNLSRGMKDLDGDFAKAFNRRWSRVGPLFQGRFHGKLIEKETYLLEVIRYVVLNPVRAGMVEHPGQWPWSSYRATAGMTLGPPWLEIDDTLRRFDSQDPNQARREYRAFVARGVGKDLRLWDELRCGFYLGSVQFGEKLEGLLGDKKNDRHFPRLQRHPDRPSLVELNRALSDVMDLGDQPLRRLRGGDARAIFAYLAREDAIVPLHQIGEVLGIGESAGSKLIRKARLLVETQAGRLLMNRIRERIRTNRNATSGHQSIIEPPF